MFQSYRVYLNQFLQHLLQYLLLGKWGRDDQNPRGYSTQETSAKLPSQKVFSNQQLSQILVNYLMLPGAGSKSLSKELSLRLFQNTENGAHLVPTLYCFKRLFAAVDSLHKPLIQKPNGGLLGLEDCKKQALQLVTTSNFQNYTPILVDFYLRVSNRGTSLTPTPIYTNT
jgi:hypothetical protein